MADATLKKGRSKLPRAKAEKAGKKGITYPAAAAYLVVDTKKCDGCCSCMAACSLVHEGEGNYSLSRIQIAQDAFARFSGHGQRRAPDTVGSLDKAAAHVADVHRFGVDGQRGGYIRWEQGRRGIRYHIHAYPGSH